MNETFFAILCGAILILIFEANSDKTEMKKYTTSAKMYQTEAPKDGLPFYIKSKR